MISLGDRFFLLQISDVDQILDLVEDTGELGIHWLRSNISIHGKVFTQPKYQTWLMADNPPSQSYDWRLAYLNLEVRDQYFSRLKSHIEFAHRMSGKKVNMPTKARLPKNLLTLETICR